MKRVQGLKIAVPTGCPAKWEEMTGDGDTVRTCEHCRTDMHNLSAMSDAEIEAVLAAPEPTCVRFYYRPDGTMLREAPERSRASLRLGIGLAASLTYAGAVAGLAVAVDQTKPVEQAQGTTDSGALLACGIKLTVRPSSSAPAKTARDVPEAPAIPEPANSKSNAGDAATSGAFAAISGLLTLMLLFAARRVWSRDRLRSLDAWSVPRWSPRPSALCRWSSCPASSVARG